VGTSKSESEYGNERRSVDFHTPKDLIHWGFRVKKIASGLNPYRCNLERVEWFAHCNSGHRTKSWL
jgi:hypothetical protein